MPDLPLELSTWYATSSMLTSKATRKPENKNWINKQFDTGEGLGSMLGFGYFIDLVMFNDEMLREQN